MGIVVRVAHERDVGAIRDVFISIYGLDYPFQDFYDERWLMRSVFNDDIVMLVAEDTEDGKILGTASVVFDIGAHSDLIGEFGRLAVHAEARGRGVGSLLMEHRIAAIDKRLHVGIVENRCVHPFSQRISEKHGFVCVGFLPMKHRFRRRESISLWIQLFGHARELRRNHPRVVPEAHGLAHLALQRSGLAADAIVDEDSPSYASEQAYVIDEMTSDGLPSLMRIERGRVRNREIFGPMRLQYGFFKLSAKQARYLIARHPDTGAVAGAIGFVWDDVDRAVKVFEMIARTDDVVRAVFNALQDECSRLAAEYVEVDVSAYAPRMQRTLIELGYLPIAYIPGAVFHHVERLDIVKMARLLVPLDIGEVHLLPASKVVAELVIASFARKMVLPRLAEAMGDIALFSGLSAQQATRVAGECTIRDFEAGEALFHEGGASTEMFLVLDGVVEVSRGGHPVGRVNAGDVVGEISVITGDDHSATAVASGQVTAALLSRNDLAELSRLRPDIATQLYRNASLTLGRRLRGTYP